MDAITLDHLLAEIMGSFGGCHLGRPRMLGPHAIGFELSGSRDAWLVLDAERLNPSIAVFERDEVRSWTELPFPVAGRTRQGLLLIRKHIAGARLIRFERIAGERTVRLHTTRGDLLLRFSGPAPTLRLAVENGVLATLGEGSGAGPTLEPSPERDWDRLSPERFEMAVAEAVDAGRSLTRAILGVCPGLGPALARQLDGRATSFEALRARLRQPVPTLVVPGPLDSLSDADLAPPDAIFFGPIPLDLPGRSSIGLESWSEAAQVACRLRRRGLRFARAQKAILERTRRETRRLLALEANLVRDRTGLADASALRRQGEALLASPSPSARGDHEVVLADPYQTEQRLRIPVDPAVTLPVNANRLFAKARRIERARIQIERRLAETRQALHDADTRERGALAARQLRELDHPPSSSELPPSEREPRRFLTTRGLTLLIGRSARENHQLTFGVARPGDLWLHARDVPGAHVILLDRDGRAGAADFREAAEVAAFFSEARSEARVDVHLTRRKHLRPIRGGQGRVQVLHSDTLRVEPKDPAGRLRRR